MIGLGPLHSQLGLRVGHLSLGHVFPFDGVGISISHRNTHLPFSLFHVSLLLEAGGLFADRLFLFQIGHSDGPVAFRHARPNRLFFAGIGYLDGLVPFGGGHAGFTHLLVVGHVTTGLLDGFGRRLLADGVDVAGFVRNVGDVHVDQLQPDFPQFRFQVLLDLHEELVTVAIDLLDAHAGNDLSQDTEDDFLSLLADLADR